MAYIVDLMVIMDILFTLGQKKSSVSQDDVTDAITIFERQHKDAIHRQIREIALDLAIPKAIMDRDIVCQHIVALINTHTKDSQPQTDDQPAGILAS